MHSTSTSSESTDDGQYDVRPFEPGDREGYLALHDQVLGGGGSEWFAWKYERNPFVDHVPIVVATEGDDVVGAKSAVAVTLRAGEETVDALQPADTMVHPDHRRRGLFSRMTEFTKEYYADRSATLFFNFPNERTLAGGLKHGWEQIGHLPTYYRIQDGASLAGATVRETLGPAAAVLDVAVDGYLTVRDGLAPVPDEVSVDVRDGVPADVLAELYRRNVPDRLHAERSEAFYEWRFDNPDWSYRTYLAGAPDPDVAVVTGRGAKPGERVVNCMDVVPLVGDGRRRALAAVLGEICARNDDAAVVAASGRAIPDDLLRSFGFLADTQAPLSAVSSPSPYVTYALADGDWTVAGLDVRREDSWLLTFAEQDTR